MREFKDGDLLYAADLNAITEAIESAQQQVNEATKQTYTDALERDLREAISTKTTAAQVQDLIAQIPTTDLSGLATEDYVQDKINQALSSYATKTELNAVDAKIVRHYDLDGNIVEITKEVTAQVTTSETGRWTCDYSKVGFTEAPKPVGIVAKNTSTDLADRLIASLGSAAITATGASGTLMGATSVGLLSRESLVEKNGTLFVTFKGK